jgi:hypothetical protein
MNKVIEIALIENVDKKKKIRDKDMTLLEYKNKIINDLEDVITLKFFQNKNPEEIKRSDDFIDIRNKFVIFYNSYIDLNKLFMHKNAENLIISDIIDDLVNKVIFRYESLENMGNIKEIELLKAIIDKNEEDRIHVDMA